MRGALPPRWRDLKTARRATILLPANPRQEDLLLNYASRIPGQV